MRGVIGYVHKHQKEASPFNLQESEKASKKAAKKAAKEADNDAISPALLLQAGETYEGMNQNEKALELYNEIKTKYYLSPVAQDIDKYIERATK